MSEEIKMQQNRNNALQMQLDMLVEETPAIPVYPVDQLNHNTAYQKITHEQDMFGSYIEDVMALLDSDVSLSSYQVQPGQNKIVIIINGTSDTHLYEYVIDLFEYHGVVSVPTETNWITERPTYRFTSPTTMEVTIYYA
jgi:hypothetical protein